MIESAHISEHNPTIEAHIMSQYNVIVSQGVDAVAGASECTGAS
jgi:hypothetical protein